MHALSGCYYRQPEAAERPAPKRPPEPILTSLQNAQKLTDDCLEGLAELLKLLTTYFKVEIGSRLIDHTKVFAEPTIVQRASFSSPRKQQAHADRRPG